MKYHVPHVIPYQGSKRNLAQRICNLFPQQVDTLYEPFCGSAAISVYAAVHGLAKTFVIGDSLKEIVELHREIIENPEEAITKYKIVWEGQQRSDSSYFNMVRERFNSERDPIDLLYLIARCVKNAVRFNKYGKFTQSVDKRRLGTKPERIAKSIRGVSSVMRGKVKYIAGDWTETITNAGRRDLVYLDPPYLGTSIGRDKRYFQQVQQDELVNGLEKLVQKDVKFILSYDGRTGNKIYGEPLPKHLGLKHLHLPAGRSTQSTLQGGKEDTVESLYITKNIENGKHGEIIYNEKESRQPPLPLFA